MSDLPSEDNCPKVMQYDCHHLKELFSGIEPHTTDM